MEDEKKNEMFQSPPQFENRLARQKPGNSSKKYFVIILSIVVIGLVLFGATRFLTGSNNSQSAVTPTPTEEAFPTDTPTPTLEESPTPTEKLTPTATPKPSVNQIDKASGLDRSKLAIHVENGSGVSGASKKAADFLESLGYNVVESGNADSFDHEQTEIQIKTDSTKYLDLLKKDLSENYTVGSTLGEPPSDERADAVVIIGKQ